MISFNGAFPAEQPAKADHTVFVSQNTRDRLLSDARLKDRMIAGPENVSLLEGIKVAVHKYLPDGVFMFWPSCRVIDCRTEKKKPTEAQDAG